MTSSILTLAFLVITAFLSSTALMRGQQAERVVVGNSRQRARP
ncbi:MAG TPA: hypothetical protein VKS24_04830 [Bradyrhizobium sp.]|nr:hypothetical protein [Bradyrhizobium sp.]